MQQYQLCKFRGLNNIKWVNEKYLGDGLYSKYQHKEPAYLTLLDESHSAKPKQSPTYVKCIYFLELDKSIMQNVEHFLSLDFWKNPEIIRKGYFIA